MPRQRRRLHLRLPALGLRRPLVGVLLLALALAGFPAAQPLPVAAQELAPPRIWLEQDCVAPWGDDVGIPEISITVHGHNFVPGSSIDVFSWEQDDAEARVTADPYGTFDVRINVFQPIFAGSYNVQAEDVNSDGTIRADVDLLAPCPGTVTLTPGCADPAQVSQPDHQVRVNGAGWFEDEIFLVRFLTLDGQALDEARAVVRDGNFETSLTPGPLGDGLYIVIITRIQTTAAVAFFSVPCQQPQVTLEPNCGPAGAPPAQYELQISGLGHLALPTTVQPRTGPSQFRSHIEIMVDPGGAEQEFRYSGAINPEGGGWGPVTIVPFMRDEGTYNVRIRQVLEGYVISEATVLFSVPCRQPTATILPDDCGPPAFESDDPDRRYDLAISGQGFEPGIVEIFFDAIGDSGYPVEDFEAPVDENGNFNEPIDPLRRPEGVYQVHVRQDRRDGTTATIPPIEFRVPCGRRTPAISLVCDPVEPEPPDPGDVVLDSSGWFEDAPIFLSGPGMPTDPVRSNPVGRYTLRLDAGELPAGPLQIVAVQRDVRGAVVAETAPAVIALPCGTPPEPMLRVLPASIPPGFVVTIEGTFFRQGETVNLVWDSGLRMGQLMPAEVGEGGTFRMQVLIFHHDFLGTRAVTAVGAEDEPLTEPAELLVVPGRGSPPAFVPADGLTFEPDTRIVIRR